MKNLIFLFALLLSFGIYAQEVTPATNSSNESEKVIEEEVADSTKIERQELKKAVKQKDVRRAAPAVKYDMDANSAEDELNSTQAGYSVQQNFRYQKSQASISRTQRTPTDYQQVEMNNAVNFFEVNAPNSFEYHYFKYASTNYNVDEVKHLKEAERLRPENTDVHVQFAAYNIIKRNEDSALLYLNKLTESNRLVNSVLNYTEDVLLSVPENGTLITHGFDDTYGAYYNQKENGVREDVKIISLDFLQSDHYIELLKEDGYAFPESNVIDVEYLKKFCALNASKNLSISMTTPKEYFQPLMSNLYVTGLVFAYNEGEYENYSINDELWNSTLKKHLVKEATDEKAKQLSSNYLPMLLQLRKVYMELGEEEKLKVVDDASDRVGVQCKKYEQVQKLKSSY